MKYSNRNHKFLNFDLFATEATLTTPKNRLRSVSTISMRKPSEYQTLPPVVLTKGPW
jgi:hypothetical protein